MANFLPRKSSHHQALIPRINTTNKTPKTIELKDNNGQTFFKETRYAQVNLIPVPFVSIREQLSADLLKEPTDPATLMLSLIKEEEYRLIVNLLTGKIIYKNLELDLMPARLALYTFFALQKKNCLKEVETCDTCTECFLDIQSIYEKQDEITDLYRKIQAADPLMR